MTLEGVSKVPDYYKFRKNTGRPEDRFITDEEQQHSVDEVLLFGEDEDIIREAPDIEANQSAEADGVRIKALERAMAALAQRFYQFRADAADEGSRNYPRIEVLVDTNCLITFTGPMNTFDKNYFMALLDTTIEGRLALEECKEGLDVPEEKETPYHM
jgi:hypothetical protein